jgi:hypothetical protein
MKYINPNTNQKDMSEHKHVHTETAFTGVHVRSSNIIMRHNQNYINDILYFHVCFLSLLLISVNIPIIFI